MPKGHPAFPSVCQYETFAVVLAGIFWEDGMEALEFVQFYGKMDGKEF